VLSLERVTRPKNRKSLKIQTLLAYQNIEKGLKHPNAGNLVLFLEVGLKGNHSQIISNFLSIYATDKLGKLLLIDLNYLEPLKPNSLHKGKEVLDKFVRNKTTLKLHCHKDKRVAFDLLPLTANTQVQDIQFIVSPTFKDLIEHLSQEYTKVFIRGLPDHHLSENDHLLQISTDSLLMLDATKSKFQDIELLLSTMDPSKIRGFILGNT